MIIEEDEQMEGVFVIESITKAIRTPKEHSEHSL